MIISILTPEKEIVSQDVNCITLPGKTGSFQILKNHAPIISALVHGEIKANTGNNVKIFKIKEGIVEASDNKITILSDHVDSVK